MSLADWANTIYGYFFVSTAIGFGVWRAFQHGVKNSVESHFNDLREELKPIREMLDEMDKRTSRIEYALYNDGQTGLINKVDSLIENQQIIRVDVEVMKAKYDN